VFALLQFAPNFIPTKPFELRLAEQIEGITGAKVEVQGATTLSLFPQPTIQFRDIKISQYDVVGSPVVSIGFWDATIPFASMIAGAPRLEKMVLDVLSVNLQRDAKKEIVYGFLDLQRLRKLTAEKPDGEVTFEIRRGKVEVSGDKKNAAQYVNDIFMVGNWSDNLSLIGAMQVDNQLVNYSFTRTGSNGVTPFSLSLQHGDSNNITLKGDMDLSAESPVINAKFEADSANISPSS
jgi:hypothetical protein